MKKLLYPLFALLILFTVGCGDDDDTNPLVGVWEMTSASFLIQSNPSETITITADNDNSETMILGEDGTYSVSGNEDGYSYSCSGSWSSTANKLTIMEDGEDTLILDFSISGSTLTLISNGTYGGNYDESWDMVTTMTYTKS